VVFLPEVSLAPAKTAAPAVKGGVAVAVLYGGGGDELVGFKCRFRWQLVVTDLSRVWWWRRLRHDCYGGDEDCNGTDRLLGVFSAFFMWNCYGGD
jgi:hypothetical protein